jgi:hypothetical protein
MVRAYCCRLGNGEIVMCAAGDVKTPALQIIDLTFFRHYASRIQVEKVEKMNTIAY